MEGRKGEREAGGDLNHAWRTEKPPRTGRPGVWDKEHSVKPPNSLAPPCLAKAPTALPRITALFSAEALLQDIVAKNISVPALAPRGK